MSDFRTYWEQRIGKDWTNIFEDCKEELEESIKYYKKEISRGVTIYPDTSNVFRVFKETPYKELKVIIVGLDPYSDGRANGLGFSNDPNKTVIPSPSLEQMIDSAKLNFYDEIDFGLDHWVKQGVLLLNSALTVEKGIPNSHSWMWRKFTTKLLSTLSNRNSGLIFCLWGQQTKSFRKNINENLNYVLEYSHPASAAYSKTNWNCPHFKEINEILKKNNNIQIQWNNEN